MSEANDKIVFALVGGLGDRTPSGDHGGPQLSIHTSTDRDIPQAELDQHLDRFTAAFKRQRAIAEVDRIQDHILGCERMIKDAIANDASRVERYNRSKSSLAAQIKEVEAQAPAAAAEEERAWRESGRSGDFKPSERPTTPYGALKKKAQTLHAEIVKLDLEQSEPMNQLKAVIESHESAIKQAHEGIARLRTIIDPPANERAKATG